MDPDWLVVGPDMGDCLLVASWTLVGRDWRLSGRGVLWRGSTRLAGRVGFAGVVALACGAVGAGLIAVLVGLTWGPLCGVFADVVCRLRFFSATR